MSVQLPGFPDDPRHRYICTLGDRQFEVEFTWRPRPGSWHWTLRTREGDPLIRGVRLSPGASPVRSRPDPRLPAGYFFVVGPDPYDRDDLGDSLAVVFVPIDEVPPSPETGPEVVLA